MSEGIFKLLLGATMTLISILFYNKLKHSLIISRFIRISERYAISIFMNIASMGYVGHAIILTLAVIFLSKILYMLAYGFYLPPWEDGAIYYSRLTERSSQQFFIGCIIGFLIYIQINLYRKSDPTASEQKFKRGLNIPIYGLTIFTIFIPYIERLVPSATSLEISTIGKITFDSRQSNQNQSSIFVAGPGGALQTDGRNTDVLSAIDAIIDISSQDVVDGEQRPACAGMIQRDIKYVEFIDSKLKITPASGSLSAARIQEATRLDDAFFKALLPVEACLRSYAEKYLDYRLLLIDMKPVIQSLTAMLSTKNASIPVRSADKFRSTMRDVIQSAGDYLELAGESKSICSVGMNAIQSDKILEAFNYDVLPYKTLMLSHILSAVGSSDKAILEIATWIERNRGKIHPWYIVRSQIEIGLMLSSSLPDGERSPVYHQYAAKAFPDFEALIPNFEFKSWSPECHTKTYYERLLMSSFMTNANSYVKSASDLDQISTRILKIASNLKNADLNCFKDIPGFDGEEKGWRASILTNAASATLAATYSDRLYGRNEGSRQKDMRQDARRDLLEALRLLNSYNTDKAAQSEADTGIGNVCKKEALPVAGSAEDRKMLAQYRSARQILTRPKWGETRSTALNMLRKIVDTPD